MILRKKKRNKSLTIADGSTDESSGRPYSVTGKFSKATKLKGSNISSSAMNKNKTKNGSYISSTSGNGKNDTGNGGSYHLKDGGSSNNSHGSSNSGCKPMSIPGKAGLV